LNLEARAKALYGMLPTPCTSWDKLGTVTRSVWLERASEEPGPEDEIAWWRNTPTEPCGELELKAPAGYTADELERDNPHNQWMNESKL
jgi:hypothetical protein